MVLGGFVQVQSYVYSECSYGLSTQPYGEPVLRVKILDPDPNMGQVNCGIAAHEVLNVLNKTVLNYPLTVPSGLCDAPFLGGLWLCSTTSCPQT